MFNQIFFLLLLSSCAIFRPASSIKNIEMTKLIQSVKLIGEGRGRLSIDQSQYVFSFESLLKENKDWILAVSIPLQGEEVMILKDLPNSTPNNAHPESFERRIQHEFIRLDLEKDISAQQFLNEFRSLVRFHLAHLWGQNISCEEQHDLSNCNLDGEKFQVSTTDKNLKVTKVLANGALIVLTAQNLTESFFSKTDFHLYANQANLVKKVSSLSLELFWK